MPAKKPEELHHNKEFRIRFTQGRNAQILELAAKLTDLDGGEQVKKSELVRALTEMMIDQMSSPQYDLQILASIYDAREGRNAI
ncbi:hypothetical protein [Marinomonas atlantica]|uniref:hypothetical protein n=1 Tax=Marinomonas atlantica TaxID=1806668 RepID=UPI0008347E0C|nr:hypothetical protein [Marinomonas atlantica]